jgi:hypothetical protein
VLFDKGEPVVSIFGGNTQMGVTTQQVVASHNLLLSCTAHTNRNLAVGSRLLFVDDCIAIYVSDLHEPV